MLKSKKAKFIANMINHVAKRQRKRIISKTRCMKNWKVKYARIHRTKEDEYTMWIEAIYCMNFAKTQQILQNWRTV